MNIDQVIFLGHNAMMVTLIASAPMLLSGMVVGLIISIIQSVTQIQEITLTFVPKIVVVMAAFVIFLPFMSDTILGFVTTLLESIGDLGRR